MRASLKIFVLVGSEGLIASPFIRHVDRFLRKVALLPLELSSGAMTSRLDRLEEAGLVRRLPDPDDRRGVVVELTDAGREAWDTAASGQGRQETFIACALTKSEQQELNGLLRKLMLAFEAQEPSK